MRNLLTSTLLAIMVAAPAAASDYGVVTLDSPVYAGYLPACGEPGVVASIGERFAYQDANILHSGIGITGIGRVHERAYKAGAPGFIDRRYCGATAWLSNGRRSEVVYVIEGPGTGFAGFGWHVESCLPGYDPYHVYDARCRSIRP